MLTFRKLVGKYPCEFCNKQTGVRMISGYTVEDSVICEKCLFRITKKFENLKRDGSKNE